MWQGALERLARRRDLRVYMIDSAIARPPACGGRRQALGRQAIRRSRGGPSTKLQAVVEARGPPVEVVTTPGQASGYGLAEALPKGRAGDAVPSSRTRATTRTVSSP